jgi:hypothetical protein
MLVGRALAADFRITSKTRFCERSTGRTALTLTAGKQIADLAIAAHLPSCYSDDPSAGC